MNVHITVMVRMAVVGLLMSTTVATSHAQDPVQADKDELLRIQGEWAAARVAGDAAYLEHLYAKEFRIFNMNGEAVDRASDIAVFAVRPRVLEPSSIVDEDMEVSVYGDVAVVTGIENLEGTFNGVRGPDLALRFTNVFVRRDGRWQMVTHHSTPIRQP